MKLHLQWLVLVWIIVEVTGKTLEPGAAHGRVKRNAVCGKGNVKDSVSFAKTNSPPTYRYPFGKATYVRAKRFLSNGLPAPPQHIRLRGERDDLDPNEGRVEVQALGQFGMICDGYWNMDDANVACYQLGFKRGALKAMRGSSFGVSRIHQSADILFGEIRCSGNEKSLQNCSSKPLPICKSAATAGVVCLTNEGCPYGWSGANGMCYRVMTVPKTVEEAQASCERLGAKMSYFLTPEDNNYISDSLAMKWPDVKAVWTGGQWRETKPNNKGKRYGAWVWGDTNHIVTPTMKGLFFQGFYNWQKGKRPIPDFRKKSCIAMSRIYVDIDRRNQTTDVNYMWWDNISCKQKLPFVCQRPYFESDFMKRNCYNDRGVGYRGNVSRTDTGSICEKWTAEGSNFNSATYKDKGLGDHSFCRNPDNDIKPWCWVNAKRGIFGYCNLQRCDLWKPPTIGIFKRKVGELGFGRGKCSKEEFFCPSMYQYRKERCLKREMVCDGQRDCVDSEDESDHFCRGFQCSKSEIYCKFDRYCIPKDRHCNGRNDCSDGEDEQGCAPVINHLPNYDCTEGSMLKIKKISYKGSSTDSCATMCTHSFVSSKTTCMAFNFVKANGKSVLFDSCELLSQTASSSGESLTKDASSTYCQFKKTCADTAFSCKNGRCIDKKLKCNSLDDCGDRSDEVGCKSTKAESGVTLPFMVRLAGGKNKWSGRVEVRHRGEWGLVCDDSFDLNDATVVCKQLGFARAVQFHQNAQLMYGRGNGNFLMDEVKCRGTERTLAKCKFDGWGKSDCSANEVAGVVCDVTRPCEEDEFRCKADGKCVGLNKVCDGKNDCADKSDEQSCDVTIQLIGGANPKEGRVELRRNFLPGSVCDDQFDDNDARVICRQLGYKGNAVAVKNGRFKSGVGLIWLTGMSCIGNETELTQCPNLKWGASRCDHSEDAGVRCDVKIKKGPKDESKSGDVLSESWKELLGLKIQCGLRPIAKMRDRVMKGYVAEEGMMPWQVGIRKFSKDRKYQGHHCGGTIISEWWIITAAHCFSDSLPKNQFVLRVGDLDNTKNETGEQWLEIDQLLIHEKFVGPPLYDYDLTLIKVKPVNGRGIIFSDTVQPACMPTKTMTMSTDVRCHVSGWGSLGGFRFPKKLQVADIPVISRSDCKELYKDGFSPRMTCAGFQAGGIDTCQGDSGGPLVCRINGKYTAWGQCSWGNGCAIPNNPGVYAKVQAFIDWIKEQIGKNQ